MVEKVSVKRYLKAGVVVTVTQQLGSVTVSEKERVLGPTPGKIKFAVRLCRARCEVLREGVALADNEGG